MPFEYRGGPEFLIYELIDTSEEFNIGIDSPSRIPSHVEFDYENKIMNYSYSNGAWDSFFYSYKITIHHVAICHVITVSSFKTKSEIPTIE